jgi:hypothetical protein
MQKTIRVLAIIAVALATFSLMLLLASIPLQRMLAREVYGYHDDFMGALPQFPLIPFLSCFLRGGCMALLIICCGNKKGGIWLELLTLVFLVMVLPVITQITSLSYNVFLGTMSTQHIATNAVVTNIANFCLIPSNLGQALAYVTCGMSIAFKKMSRIQPQ